MDQKTFELMRSSESNEWWTPLSLYHKLNDEFHFDIDPAADSTNRLGLRIFYTKKDDGLTKEWPLGNVYCNPPYSREVKKWVAKCAEHALKGKGVVVMLVPSRTETMWFQTYIWDGEKNKPRDGVEVRFIRGRLQFDNPEGIKNTAPFPSAVIVFRVPSYSHHPT